MAKAGRFAAVKRFYGEAGEAGEGRIGCIFWGAVFVVIFVIAWQAVPVKVASSELYDHMIDQANFADRRSAAGMKKAVLQKAEDLDLPLEAKNLTVTKTSSRVKMDAKYTVVVDFPLGFDYEWDFHHEVDRPIYIY